MISLTKILNKLYLTKFSFYLLLSLVLISFAITFYLMLPNNDLVKNPLKLQYFLLADVFFVIILLALIIRQLILIIIYKRSQKDESRLYIKFVNLFAAMAVGPTLGLVVITSLFFNLEFRTWYGGAVKDAVVNSNIVARDYENEIQAEIISDTQLIMREIIKVSRNNEVNINAINQGLSEFINLRTISNIYLFNRSGEIYSNFKDQENKNYLLPSDDIFEILDKNRVYIFQLNKNSISAYKKINFLGDVFMQVNRELNTNIWEHVSATKDAYNIYTAKESESAGIQITYSMIFVLFSIGFILVAVLIGFNLARRLSKPISNLIESANEISKGNFDSRVSEIDQFEEIKVLISSYNKMIGEIESKQNQLISKSNEDEEKRLFIEAILSLLTIGVISLDQHFNIIFYNQTTNTLFKGTKKLENNSSFLLYFSEWSKIFNNFKKSKKILENFQTEILIKDDLRNFNVRIIKELKDDKINGYIVAIDDTTSFILAEKHAAWSDIARKIAHEVKNPLTPIKLSAERIEKKYLNKEFDNDDIKVLTETISRQVDDIGKLIDEFSSFARMPEPEIKLDNLSKCLNESFLLFSNSHKNIKFNINRGKEDIFFQFDKFQISQCFNNLIKNAVEAVEKIPNPSITINLKTDKIFIFIEVIDNGIGVSKEKIGKIFEPYFTTKSKGTGLGLSIVKKIIEDHNGKIKIDKNKQMAGTTSFIIFENINV
ncbi:ATP-binding protein [Alphaproteobacteria bacterium]|nr:ATP-binding protein [Alphaproteobacteria bacterium]